MSFLKKRLTCLNLTFFLPTHCMSLVIVNSIQLDACLLWSFQDVPWLSRRRGNPHVSRSHEWLTLNKWIFYHEEWNWLESQVTFKRRVTIRVTPTSRNGGSSWFSPEKLLSSKSCIIMSMSPSPSSSSLSACYSSGNKETKQDNSNIEWEEEFKQQGK